MVVQRVPIALTILASVLLVNAIPESIIRAISEHFSSIKTFRTYFCKGDDVSYFAKANWPHSTLNNKLLISSASNMDIVRLTESEHKLGIFLDTTCHHGMNILNQNSESFNASFMWMMWSPNPNLVLDTLETSRLNIDSDVTLITDFSNEGAEGFSLLDVYRAHNSLPFVTFEYQRLIKGNWYSIAPKLERNDLGGIELTGAVFLPNLDNKLAMNMITNPAVVYMQDVRWRYGVALFDSLCKLYLNCSLRLVRANCNDESSSIPCNGSTGVIKLVEEGAADFGIIPYAMDSAKMNQIDYSIPVMLIKHIYLFLQPKLIDYYSALARPLSTECWILLFVLLVFGVFALRAVAPYDTMTTQNDGWSGSIFLIISALSQEGFPDEAYKLTTRIIYVSLIGLTFFAYIYYCTVIVNWLLLPPTQSIRTSDELFNSHFTVAVADSPYLRNRLASEEPLDAKLKAKMSQSPLFWDLYSITTEQFLDTNTGVARIVRNPFAIFGEETSLLEKLWEVRMTYAETCSIGIVNDEVRPRHASFVLPHNSPYKEFLRRGIVRSYERSNIARLKRDWFPTGPSCLWIHDALPFGFRPHVVAYAIMVAGIVLSTLFFGFEKLTLQLKRRILAFKERRVEKQKEQ